MAFLEHHDFKMLQSHIHAHTQAIAEIVGHVLNLSVNCLLLNELQL